MLDYGSTSTYVLFSLDVVLSNFEYLAIDWDSDLGVKLREIMVSVSNSLPESFVIET